MTRYGMVGPSLAAVVVLSFCALSVADDHEPIGVVLKYRAEANATPGGRETDMDKLVLVINARLAGRGEAKATADGSVEVDLYGKLDKDQLQSIKQRISAAGDLEFRITADPTQPDDRPIIEQAKLLPPNQTDVMLGGKKVAQWVPYSEKEFGPPSQADRRVVKRMGGQTPQALVLMDPWNVTGQSVASVSQGVNERGGPAINFSLDEQGAARFGQLTSRNKPNPATGAVRYMGIIFDNRLISAPSIRTTISKRGQISGAMTDKEVDLMLSVLSAGRLPCFIHEVSQQPVAE
jgi:preprotein translocase subunit SecD